MDATADLPSAYRALLDAAETVAASGARTPPAGEWDADQILAHVSLVTAATIAAIGAVSAGTNPAYDNRAALDRWTIDRTVERAGGGAGLRARLRVQADALRALADSALGEAELDTPIPALLLSNDKLMFEGLMPLRDLVGGLAAAELPGHTRQLLALRPGAAAPSAT